MPFTHYAVHVKAKDSSGNEAAETVLIEYRPRQIDPVELHLPAVAKEFLRGDGKPALMTPVLTLSNGESISSERDIFATLAADGDIPLVVNGITVAPGATERVATAYNFLLTGGRIELSLYPSESEVVGTAALRLATDKPAAPVVDVAVKTWTASAQVTAESWQILQGWGEAKFHATLDEGTRCALTTDREQAIFADNVASPVCLLSWTQLPAGVDAHPPTSAAPGVARALGYPHEAGPQPVAVDVGVFGADGTYESLFSTSETAEIESLFGQIVFEPTRDTDALMLGVESFDVQLEQTSGPACGVTVDEEHARSDGAVGRKTCFIEWTHLPEAVTQWPGRTKPWLSGHLTATSDSIDWRVTVFTPAGNPIVANEQSIALTAEYPSAPQIEFEADDEVGEALAAIPLAGGRVGTLSIESVNADLDILVERAGDAVLDEKVAAGFSNWGQGAGRLRQSRRINDERAAVLWETRLFTAKVGFSELPEVSTEVRWEGIYVPSYDIRPIFDPATVNGTGVQNVLSTEGLHVSVYMAEGSNGPEAYDEATMGVWEIHLARMVRFDEYEPLTELVRTENGIASFDLELNDIEESFLRIMPIAVLRSPDGRYERVVPASRPLVFVVVNGAELGAELEARRVSGPAPLTLMVNAALQDRLDYQAVGDVRWELRPTDVEGAEWQTIAHDPRRPMSLRHTFERGFYELRMTVKNKFSGAQFITEPLTIAAYNVPDVTVAGPRNIFVGDPARFAVQGEEEGDEALVVEWSEDRGATWLAGREYTVRSELTGRLDLWMRARFENTPEEDPLGYRVIRSRAAYRAIRGPGVRVAGQNRLELGATGTYTVRMREPYPNMDVMMRGAFILPDGTRVEAESIEYTATEADFAAGKIDIQYEAWIEGYENAGAVNRARQRVAVWRYEWPEWDLIASRGSRFAPSEFTIELRPRDFRGTLEDPQYAFDLPEGVEVLNAGPTSRQVRIDAPGEYLFQAHVTDGRGHAATAELRHEVLEAPELLVSFAHRPGNAYYRAPLDLIFRPKVQGGHPKDRALEFRYFLDGRPFEDESRFPVITLDPGEYLVELEVETQMGQVERANERFRVFPNQPPECELEQWETSLGWRFNANCSDVDGRIIDFLWTLDGEEITQRGSRMSVSRLGRAGPPTVTVHAVDDAGDFSAVQHAR